MSVSYYHRRTLVLAITLLGIVAAGATTLASLPLFTRTKHLLPSTEAEWTLIIDKEEDKRRPKIPDPYYIGYEFSFSPFPGVWIKSDHPGTIAEEVLTTEFANTHIKSFASPRILGVRPSGSAFAKTEIEGITLESCLAGLDQLQLDFVVHDLGVLIAEMRSLSNPHGNIGSVSGGPFQNAHFGRPLAEPFKDLHEMNAYWRVMLDPMLSPSYVDLAFTEDLLPTTCPIVFTHGDLNPRNIIVNPGSKRIVGIIDWAWAGWYPEYWECGRMLSSGCLTADYETLTPIWIKIVRKIFPSEAKEGKGYCGMLDLYDGLGGLC